MADPANQDRWDKRSAIALIVYHLVITEDEAKYNYLWEAIRSKGTKIFFNNSYLYEGGSQKF